MSFVVALIDAAAGEESLKTCFVCPLVNRQAAFGALEVAGGLLEGVFICCLWVLLLSLEQLLDGAGLSELLAHRLVRA